MSALGHKKTLVNGSAEIRIVPVASPKGNVMNDMRFGPTISRRCVLGGTISMLALGNPLRTQSTAVHPFPAGFVWGASLGDSATPSTRIRFSVHTGDPTDPRRSRH